MHRRLAQALSVLALTFSLALPARAITARTGQTQTLLPDGRVMVAGGAGALTDISFVNPKTGVITTGPAIVSRSSHTATLLGNGNVMLIGGWDGAAAVNSIQIINPRAAGGAGSIVTSVTPAAAARFNHTATLLPDGHVLACGGASDNAADQSFFANCIIVDTAGTINNTVNMLLATGRGYHTANLLRDGRVFITGGFTNPAVGSLSPLITSEVFTCTAANNCANGTITAGKALNVARALHQATMMADGRILITGGYNGDDRFVTGHKVGLIDSTEIFDPVADAMATAAPTLLRQVQHAAYLKQDGSVMIYGGMANMTTTYLTASNVETFLTGTLNGCFSGACGTYTGGSVMSTMTINNASSSANLRLNFNLSVPARGVLNDAEILFSSPQAAIPNGKINFVYGQEDHPTLGGANTGIKVNLDGVPVECNQTTGVCGVINRTLAVSGISGQYQFDPYLGALETDESFSGDDGCIQVLPASIINTSGNVTINDGGTNCVQNNPGTGTNISYACGRFVFRSDKVFNGANLRIGSMQLLSGAWVYNDPTAQATYTATLTGGTGVVTTANPMATTVDADTEETVGNFRACFGSLTGTINTDTDIAQSTPIEDTLNTADLTISSIRLTYTLDTMDLAGVDFNVDKATVVVRRMITEDFQCYKPKTNAWSFDCVSPKAQTNTMEVFSAAATVLPDTDVLLLGGKRCSTYGQGGCTAFIPKPAPATLSLPTRLEGSWQGTASMSRPRGNFTSTVLPSGKVLLVGGTDGQNVLSDVDMYDPVANSMSPAPSLTVARDLHTATLLVNGRVLVAGGFATTAASTGTTNSAELYLPSSNSWFPAASLNQARDNHTATVMPDGRVLVVGGYQNGSYVGAVEFYDPSANTWTTFTGGAQPTLVRPRALHTATLLQDGRLMIAGGVNADGPLSSVEIFDGTQWTELAGDPMPQALHSHTAVLLPGGDVMVTGGSNGLGEVTNTYRFRPTAAATFRWSSAGPLSNGRMNHTVTLLPTGRVLVAGGATANGNTIGGAELFSEIGSWTPISTMTVARAYHNLVVTPNNMMTAFGGYSVNAYLASGERLPFASYDTETLLSASVRQSSITTVNRATIDRGQQFSVSGRSFKGLTEASGGGAGSADSQHYHPRLQIQALDHSGGSSTQGNGGFLIDFTTYVYADAGFNWLGASTTLVMTAPTGAAALPYGWYQMRVANNSVYSEGKLIQVGPSLPTGAVASLIGVVVSSTIVNWSWDPAPVSGNAGFNVYSATTGFLLAQLTNPTAGSWVQGGLQPNVTAQIMVAPYSMTGDGTLAYSGTYYTYASSPTALSIASVSVTSLELRWSTNGNGPGTIYEVSMSTDPFPPTGAPFTTSFSTPVPALMLTTTDNVLIQSLQPNTTHHFRVQAYNLQNFPSSLTSPPTVSGFTGVVSTVTRQTVAGLAGTRSGTTGVQWTWTDAGINPLTDVYRVYNSTSGQLLGQVTTPLFLDVGLATNTPRSVMVSVKVGGVGEGPLTQGVTVFTEAAVPNAASPSVINVSTGGFTLNWVANGNPLNTIYQCVVTSLPPFDAGVNAQSSTSTTTGFFCSVSGVNPATIFDLRVRAVNGDGFGTDAIDFTRLLAAGTTATLAATPSALTVTNTSPSSIAVTWNENNNTSSATYEVTYSLDNFASDVQFAVPFSSGYALNSVVIPNLVTSTVYSIRVRAQNPNGLRTPYSNIVSTPTFNGGAPQGAVGGFIDANAQATITGSLGNGRQITLFVPNNTFNVPVFVAISSHNTPVNAPINPCGTMNIGFQITLTPPIQPLKPVTLTASYTPAELGAVPPEQAVLHRWDPALSKCVPLNTSFNTNAQTFTSQLNHFSMFQVANVVPQSSPDFALIFPNPFYPTRGHGYVTFAQLPKSTLVGIYTLRGEKVWEGWTNGAGIMTWTGVNTSGRPVASGVYLAVAEQGGEGGKKHVYKVAVVR